MGREGETHFDHCLPTDDGEQKSVGGSGGRRKEGAKTPTEVVSQDEHRLWGSLVLAVDPVSSRSQTTWSRGYICTRKRQSAAEIALFSRSFRETFAGHHRIAARQADVTRPLKYWSGSSVRMKSPLALSRADKKLGRRSNAAVNEGFTLGERGISAEPAAPK